MRCYLKITSCASVSLGDIEGMIPKPSNPAHHS